MKLYALQLQIRSRRLNVFSMPTLFSCIACSAPPTVISADRSVLVLIEHFFHEVEIVDPAAFAATAASVRSSVCYYELVVHEELHGLFFAVCD